MTLTLDELRGKAVATVDEFAPVIGRSPRSVHRMLDAGELPELRLGRRRYVAIPAFLRLIGADPPEQRNAALAGAASETSTVGAGEGVPHG